MVLSVLDFLHNTTTLLFGVYVSAALLGVRMHRKNIWRLLCFSLAVGAVYILSFLLLGTEGTKKIYPVIIHLPLILFLKYRYHYRFPLCVLSVLTAYLCCQISNWCGLAALNVTDLRWVYYTVRICVTVLTAVFLLRYVTDVTAQLLQKPTKHLIIFGVIPFVYYLFDYFAEVYTSLLYSGKAVVVEFLGFVLCLFYIFFLFLYFRQYEETKEAEQRARLLEMQQAQSEKEIDAVRRSAQATSILRHDMRHFLSHLSILLQDGETDKAQQCISEIIEKVDNTAVVSYCRNEIVNMILASYETCIRENDIVFSHRIELPETLPISDVDMTSVLSNAIENAVHAVMPLSKERRLIRLEACMCGDHMLLSVQNTFAQAPQFADGMPIATKAGHGFGTQSIRYIVEKLHGNCQFSVSDNMFVLQVIL